MEHLYGHSTAREESEVSEPIKTLCWRCSEPYSNTLSNCPHCKATNANVDFKTAMVEMNQDRQDAERMDNT